MDMQVVYICTVINLVTMSLHTSHAMVLPAEYRFLPTRVCVLNKDNNATLQCILELLTQIL